MRVIAGKAKGKNLKAVPGDGTRPILDRVKTALFDTLRPYITDKSILDLFAGTGSVGIEALSQGAKSCTFIDLDNNAFKTIKANLESTELQSHAEVLKTDAFSYLKRTQQSFDVIYVAPPQFKAIWLETMHAIAERPELVASNGLIVVQIDPKEYEELGLKNFIENDRRKYGSTLLVFYKKL